MYGLWGTGFCDSAPMDCVLDIDFIAASVLDVVILTGSVFFPLDVDFLAASVLTTVDSPPEMTLTGGFTGDLFAWLPFSAKYEVHA